MKPTFDKERPLSWSAISSFEYDPEQWWNKYCLHGKCIRANCFIDPGNPNACPLNQTTKEMLFGKKIADSIEDGTCTIPGLLERLQEKKEHPFKCHFGKIPLIGFADAFCDKTFKILDEVKTGKKKWDQKRVDYHGQLDMYLLQNWIMNKIKPEEVTVTLHWIPTQDNGDFSISFVEPVRVQSFKTKRTMRDILNFGMRINKIYKKMKKYTKNHA
jgi:hypothetical protein